MTALRLEEISKCFPPGAPILSRVNLATNPGERVAIVGPSGAGKTTLLRLIAGLEKPDRGRLFIGEREITDAPPEARDVGLVFQNLALYPHLTVAENLAFPLRLRGTSRAQVTDRVGAIARLLQLEALLTRHPSQLSGGEAQRVAVGRALIRRPAALLMDEPLSSLAPDLRLQLRHEIIKLHEADRRPIVYVTHDHEEALALGERVAVFNAGQVQQFASPREIYERPANQFVATFIGRPRMNILPTASLQNAPIRERLRLPTSGSIGLRPEQFEICGRAEAWFETTIQSTQYGGAFQDVLVRFGAGELWVRDFGGRAFSPGETLCLRARPEVLHRFDADGRRVELAP